jgi:hypothetical protein
VRRQDVEIDRDDDSISRAGGTNPMPTTTARPKI